MATDAVLCYIRDGRRVLLQLKAKGRFGGGFWNAPGGKLADGEAPEEATVREVREETGLAVGDLRDHGTLSFYFGTPAEPDIVVRVYAAGHVEGELQANDEGKLEWFDEESLPYDQMWADDRFWLPHVLAGRRVAGVFRFSGDMTQLLSHELEVTE